MSFDYVASKIFSSNTLANKTTSLYGQGGSGGDRQPTSAPTIPVFASATSSTISVTFSVAGITGNPTPVYSINWGTAGGPYNNNTVAALVSNNTYTASMTGLTPSTQYQCQSVASNVAGTRVSNISAVMSSTAVTPAAPTIPPSVPASAQSTIPPNSISVYFNAAGVDGTPAPTYSILYGTTTSPTTSAAATLAFGSLYTVVVTGLSPSTTYFFKSVATNASGNISSAVSSGITTSAGGGGGTAPSAAPTVPTVLGTPLSNEIDVIFQTTGITGTPTPTFNILYGKTTTPILTAQVLPFGPAGQYRANVSNLQPNTTYYFKSVATNGVSPDAISAVSAGITTAQAAAKPLLQTLCCMPFLIQGPRFNDTAPWAGIDYYQSDNATGGQVKIGATSTSGQILWGSMYAGTVGTAGDLTPGLSPPAPTPYAGSCVIDGTSDQKFNANFGKQSDAYLKTIQSSLSKVVPNRTSPGSMLSCWGGFYADVLGLFGPYNPSGYPGTNPTAQQVVQSFLYNYCGITTGNSNPLNWVRTNSAGNSSYTFYFDGLILDFENVGNGNPLNSFPYAPPSSPPAFPAQATNATYAPYIDAIGDIPSQYYAITSSLFLGNAPVSLSVAADVGTTNICAPNTALNTWYPFPTATVAPTTATYNTTSSKALNHPEQMSYMDDIFVQFYNESADYYPGGQYFANLLAIWGWLALQAQKLGRKKTTINLGLAKGNIIPGLVSGKGVANQQGPTPPLGTNDPVSGYTYWYPQYCTSSPPNSISSTQNAQFWPDTGVSKDPKNVSDAILAANGILQSMTGNSNLAPSDWLSGMGFWAGSFATQMANSVYDKGNALSPAIVGGTSVLPTKFVYCWSDASYPAPNPNWNGNDPIYNRKSVPIIPSGFY